MRIVLNSVKNPYRTLQNIAIFRSNCARNTKIYRHTLFANNPTVLVCVCGGGIFNIKDEL